MQVKFRRALVNGILYKLSKFVSNATLLSMYHSLVFPYLSYCNLAWGNTYGVHLYPLIVLQKRAIRIICCETYSAHTEPLFRKLKLLCLNDIHKYLSLEYIYKKRHLFHDFSNHGYQTRNRKNIRDRYCRLVSSKRGVGSH